MQDFLIYGGVGVGATIIVVLLMKFLGGRKGKTTVAKDTKLTEKALKKASELLAKRAVVKAETEEDHKRVEEKLAIKDPIEKLKAIADELKDL